MRHVLSLRPAGRCKTVRRPTSWRRMRFARLQRAREEQAQAIAQRKAQNNRDHHSDEASPRSGMRAEHADVDAAVQAAEEATHNPGI